MLDNFRKIIVTSLRHNHPGLMELLGICPLLAFSNTLVNGLGLSIASLIVLCATNLSVSAIQNWLPEPIRLPASIIIIAGFVTAVELLCEAFFFDLYLALGVLLPLIATNYTLLGRAAAFASRHPVSAALADAVAQGYGVALVLVTVGTLRELIGKGTLLSGAETLFGDWGAGLHLSLSVAEAGFTLALLPAGAFFALALLAALRNAVVASGDLPVERIVSTGDKSANGIHRR